MASILDYMSPLGGQDACCDIIRDISKNPTRTKRDPVTGCWLFQGSTTKDGYGQIQRTMPRSPGHTGQAPEKAFSLHVIAAIAITGQNIPPGHHAAHRCNHANCFYPPHMVVEPREMNMRRKGCAGVITCSHGHTMHVCTHTPTCVRPPVKVRCGESPKEPASEIWI
ncbi:hypothetical protein BJX61DRAFT_541267 [Aspergillus egyptiacus]|nr:hypothetical protein BJX61DRAFT_541267 [Aspergillus egyptiacus]